MANPILKQLPDKTFYITDGTDTFSSNVSLSDPTTEEMAAQPAENWIMTESRQWVIIDSTMELP